MVAKNKTTDESLLDFVRRMKLNRLLPVGSPGKIASKLSKSENAVRGVSKGHWGDEMILEEVANELERCGEVGKQLRAILQENKAKEQLAA